MSFARFASRIPSIAGSVNATSAKTTGGMLYAVNGYNAAATVRYLKLYNKATAPTVGTDVPELTFALPATSVFRYEIPNGYLFTVGIGYGITTAAADNSTAAPAAADIVGLNVVYG